MLPLQEHETRLVGMTYMEYLVDFLRVQKETGGSGSRGDCTALAKAIGGCSSLVNLGLRDHHFIISMMLISR